MLGQTELSPTALRCLDRQLAEAIDLAVSCRQLSDRARRDGDPLMVVVLQRLATDLTDLAGSLLPLAGVEHDAPLPPLPRSLAELGDRLGQMGLAAEVDAMAPGLEESVLRLLSKLAALYQSSRELLLASVALHRD
jgi:hypothetical protein